MLLKCKFHHSYHWLDLSENAAQQHPEPHVANSYYKEFLLIRTYEANSLPPHEHSVMFCFQVVELVTGGAQMPVTNENKMFYLNLLAQYRLANQVREEVDHFLKGNAMYVVFFKLRLLKNMYLFPFHFRRFCPSSPCA